MKVNVGYPKELPIYSKEYELSDNLLKNAINMNKVQNDYKNEHNYLSCYIIQQKR